MSQKSSVMQLPQFVPKALTSDKKNWKSSLIRFVRFCLKLLQLLRGWLRAAVPWFRHVRNRITEIRRESRNWFTRRLVRQKPYLGKDGFAIERQLFR